MKTYTFAEYERGGVYLMKRTGQTMQVEAHTPLAAGQNLAETFGPDAAYWPGPAIYPYGPDRSEFCWRLFPEQQ
jgi:hypothetical protein